MGRHSSSSDRSTSRSRSHSRHRSRSNPRTRRRSLSNDDGHRVHVSDLPGSCSRPDLEKTFEKFGPLVEVWKTNNPPCFAFIVFQNKEDAEEAIREMNGRYICGSRVRVTMALPRVRERQRHQVFNSDARCYQCGQPGHFSRNCRNYEGAGRNRMPPNPRFSANANTRGYMAPRRRRRSSSSHSRSRSRSHSRRQSGDDRRRSRRSSERDYDERRRKRDSKESDTREAPNPGPDADADDIIAAQG